MAKARTNRVMRVDRRWIVYERHMPAARIVLTSFSEILTNVSQSLPNRNDEYQTALIMKLTIAAITMAQMLIVNMIVRG